MSGVVTQLPTATDAVANQLIIITETPETITRFAKYDSLIVSDVHDKSQLKAVHDARIEIRDAINAIDKERKALDEDDRERIKARMAAAKKLWAILEPKRDRLAAEESRVEAVLEAERVEAANKVYRERCEKLAEIGADPMPEQLIRAASDVSFEQLLVTARVQVEQKKIIAEQQRIAAEEASRAEAERLRLLAEENQRLAAEQAKLAADRAEFEKKQAEAAELQRQADEDRAKRIAAAEADRLEREAVQRAEQQAILDAERAELDRQRQEIAEAAAKQREELDRQRQAVEDERLRQEAAADALRKAEADRIEAEQRAIAEAERLKAVEAERVAEAERQRLKAENDALVAKAEAEILEAMRPDLVKLGLWIQSIEDNAASYLLQCKLGKPAYEIADRMMTVHAKAINEMRGML